MNKNFLFPIIFFALMVVGANISYAAVTTMGITGNTPFDIIVDSTGSVYVPNAGDDNVTKITAAGVATILGTAGDNPTSIAFDSFFSVYITNSGDNNVTKITQAGLSTVFAVTGNTPSDIVVDSSDNLFVLNTSDSTITKITPAGITSIFGSTGLFPQKLLIDTSDNIYVSNAGDDSVTKITPDGTASVLAGTGPNPVNMAIDSESNIYTANSDGTITKISQAGVSSLFATVPALTDIVVDIDNNMYAAASTRGSNTVSKITPDGTVSLLDNVGSGPFSITVDSNRTVYTANVNDFNVSKITQFILNETTAVSSPTTDTSPEYVFYSSQPGPLIFGGSCSSVSTTATQGSNTISFEALAEGTYSDCTLQVDDGVDTSNLLAVSSFTITAPTPAPSSSSEAKGGSVKYICKDPLALNYSDSRFGRHQQEYCRYNEITTSNPFNGTLCSEDLIVTDNMKKGDRNGSYSPYNQGTVTEIGLLQTHMNRLLLDEYGNQAAGPVDGIYGPLTKQGVERLQLRLNQLLPEMTPLVIDGIVGPFTKTAINNSC